MKILERYFGAQFFLSLMWTIAAFVFFYLVFDLFSRLNLILDGTIPPGSVANYYLAMIPLVFVQISPVAVLLATMYTFANLSKNNEIIAAVAGGKHPYKIFSVFLGLGVLISLTSIAVNERNVPEAARRAHEIRYGRMEETEQKIWQNRFLYGSHNRRFFIKYLDVSDNTFQNFEITRFTHGGTEVMKFQARAGKWDGQEWSFRDIIMRRFSEDGNVEETVYAESARAGEEGWEFSSGSVRRPGEESLYFESLNPGLAAVTKTPDHFTGYRLEYDEMDFASLRAYVTALEASGFDPRPEIIALHTKIALPFANLVLVLAGIPFAVKQKRGGVLIGFGAALGLSLIYYLIMNIGHLLGETILPPVMGAWFANTVFLVPGIYFLAKAKYISYR